MLSDPRLQVLVKVSFSYGAVLDAALAARERAPERAVVEVPGLVKMLLAGRADWTPMSGDEAQLHLAAHSAALSWSRFMDAAPGGTRHLYCSRAVPKAGCIAWTKPCPERGAQPAAARSLSFLLGRLPLMPPVACSSLATACASKPGTCSRGTRWPWRFSIKRKCDSALVGLSAQMKLTAAPGRPMRPVRPMRWRVVGGRARQLVVDHGVQGGDVQAARGHIGGHQHLDLAGLDAVQHLGACTLAQFTVQGGGLDLVGPKLSETCSAA